MATKAQVQGLGKFAHRGFTLEHPDDDFLLLMHDGKLVARFSQTGATKESLQEECMLHLAKRHGWEGSGKGG